MMVLPTEALFFIILAILSSTIYSLINRYVMKNAEPYAFALLTQFGAAVLFLPGAISNFSVPDATAPWLIVLAAAIIWTIFSVSNYISYKGTEVSMKQSLGQSKLILALILGLIFLKELPSFQKIVGTIIIFSGIFLLVWHPERRFARLSDPGVRWTFFASFLAALVAILDKAALRWFSPTTYGFLVYLIPGIILLFFLPGRTQHVRHLMKMHGVAAISSIVISAAFYYFVLRAYALADVTLVFPLIQLGIFITVLSGIIFLKEREHLWQKVIAAIITVAGAIIIGR